MFTFFVIIPQIWTSNPQKSHFSDSKLLLLNRRLKNITETNICIGNNQYIDPMWWGRNMFSVPKWVLIIKLQWNCKKKKSKKKIKYLIINTFKCFWSGCSSRKGPKSESLKIKFWSNFTILFWIQFLECWNIKRLKIIWIHTINKADQ